MHTELDNLVHVMHDLGNSSHGHENNGAKNGITVLAIDHPRRRATEAEPIALRRPRI